MDKLNIQVIDRATATKMAALQPWEKLAIVERLNRIGRYLVVTGVRHEHPGWSKAEISAEVARFWMERRVLEGIDVEYVKRHASALGFSEIWRQVVDCNDRPEPQPRGL
jgi:hypothetical protein